MKTVTYHRKPTLFEIKKGYGAIHYKDFKIIDCINHKETRFLKLKKWLICPIDGLRYYR